MRASMTRFLATSPVPSAHDPEIGRQSRRGREPGPDAASLRSAGRLKRSSRGGRPLAERSSSGRVDQVAGWVAGPAGAGGTRRQVAGRESAFGRSSDGKVCGSLVSRTVYALEPLGSRSRRVGFRS